MSSFPPVTHLLRDSIAPPLPLPALFILSPHPTSSLTDTPSSLSMTSASATKDASASIRSATFTAGELVSALCAYTYFLPSVNHVFSCTYATLQSEGLSLERSLVLATGDGARSYSRGTSGTVGGQKGSTGGPKQRGGASVACRAERSPPARRYT
jgi:hypothetical protein